MPSNTSSWGQERRLEFIDFRLQWEGSISIDELTSFFNCPKTQATADMRCYVEIAPKNVITDRRRSTFTATPEFTPVFATSNADTYLEKLMSSTGYMSNTAFMGWCPPFATVPTPYRELSTEILVRLKKAMQREQEILVRYQGIRNTSAEERWIAPHALAFDGFRWHVRAFCHKHQEFRDFLIARIVAIADIRPISISARRDHCWHKVAELIIVPHPGLSDAAARIVALDYGMEDGEVILPCRHALLFYLLRHLNLLESSEKDSPERKQILLKNRIEIEAFMSANRAVR